MGIAEEWELSMKLFDAAVKSPVRTWDPELLRNPGSESNLRNKVLTWAHDSPEIAVIIAADIMLYDIAKEIFKKQTTQHLGTVWD